MGRCFIIVNYDGNRWGVFYSLAGPQRGPKSKVNHLKTGERTSVVDGILTESALFLGLSSRYQGFINKSIIIFIVLHSSLLNVTFSRRTHKNYIINQRFRIITFFNFAVPSFYNLCYYLFRTTSF